MQEFGKRVDGAGGRRRTRRQKVVLTGSASHDDDLRPVIIEDVSSTGAKLRGRNLPQSGEDMQIAVGSMTLTAAVTWLGADQCGITFTTPLDEAGLNQLRVEGSWGRLVSII